MSLAPVPNAQQYFKPDDRFVLPSTVQDALLKLAWHKKLERGSSLFHKGSMPDALFGVVQGELRVSTVAPDGREMVVALLERGHWFGEVSLLIGRERVYDVTVLRPTEVAVVEAADFHKLIAEEPEIHLAFSRLVCYRLRQALSWIDDVMLMPLSARIARRLILMAPPARVERTVLNVAQEDLAAMLGASRQSINRQLKLWEADGTVALKYRAIEVLRWDWLEAHSNGSA